MFEQDYVMRLIKEFVRALLKLLFHIDTENPSVELLESTQQKELLEEFLDMVDAGEINEAENQVCELIDNKAPGSLELALLFYSYLNDKEDDFLKAHDYSREEVRLGIEGLAEQYGLGSIAKTFLLEL